MAVLTHFAKYADGDTTTSTTQVEATSCTVTWADLTGAGFAAGDDVLIIVNATLGGSNASQLFRCQVGFGTTFAGRAVVADSLMVLEPSGTTAPATRQYTWMDRRTLTVNELIYMGIAADGGATCRFRGFQLLVIKLDDLVENTDFKYAEATHSGDAPATYDTSGASVTIPAASEDWLAVATTHWLGDSITADAFMALSVGGVDQMEVAHEGENVDEEWCTGIFDALIAPSNGATIQVRYRVSSASHDVTDTKVFILRLGAFLDAEATRNTTTITHSVIDTYQEAAGLPTFGLTNNNDIALFAISRQEVTDAQKIPHGRVQVDGTSIGPSDASVLGSVSQTADDKPAVMRMYVTAQTAGSLDIDFDIIEDVDVSPTYTASEHALVAFSFELAVGGEEPPDQIAVQIHRQRRVRVR